MPVLTFKGKTAIETYHHTVPHHALDLDKKLSCLRSKDEPSLDENLIVEGDNLLADRLSDPLHELRLGQIVVEDPAFIARVIRRIYVDKLDPARMGWEQSF